jgi:ActR/RegA family two-component response regulator
MNILIIEDDVFLARRVGKIFESRAASNRVKVLHTYADFSKELPIISSYDIVLTDLKLAGSDRRDPCGYRIIRAIREKKVAIPVVVISGFSDIDSMRLAFEY